VSEAQRDAGLVRSVGTWGLAAGIFNIVVGAGIFAVPAALVASLGPYAPIAYLVCAVAVGSVAICFAEGGSRIPTSGGPYGYIEAAFGPLAGYVTGTLFWFADALACGAVAAAFADVVSSALPARWATPAHAASIVCAIGGIALVNASGVSRGVRLIDATAMLKLVPLVIFVVAGVGAIHHANFARVASGGSGGIGRALILGLFAFTGMEAPLAASGEVSRPERTIPRALAISIPSVAALYVAIQVIAQGILGPSLATSSVPLADAMARVNPALRVLMLAGAAVSMFAYISGDLLGSPRILFAFGRDGLLPKFLGRLHPRSHAPHLAIYCYAVITIGLALTGAFAELAVLSALAISVLYIGGCAASWKLARRGVALAGAPLNFKGLSAAAVVGVSSMLAMIALASRAEIVGLAAMVGTSILIYVVQTRAVSARRARTEVSARP
jgi:basic amino acid/polyamine antiporter, APA family